MHIANPIYDVVFKYLMDDNKIARLFLSTIIGKEIEEMTFKPQERVVNIEQRSFTVYRLDFSAKIKIDKEYKQVIIEIQKAKYPTDIMRFRRYLGEQYQNNDNTYLLEEDKKVVKRAIPIISIYFLGHRLEHIGNSVIRVERKYFDNITGDEILAKEDFIESLTHDSYIIQIPELKEKRRNELEILLSVFNQHNQTNDHHILNIKEEDFPEKYREMIRRLQRAVAEPKLRETMDIEDEILEELAIREREILEQKEIIVKNKKALEEKDKALVEKDKALVEKDKALEEALEEKDKVLEENKKKLEERDKVLNEKERLIEEMRLKLAKLV